MPCSCPVFWIDETITALIFGTFGYISNSFEQLEDSSTEFFHKSVRK